MLVTVEDVVRERLLQLDPDGKAGLLDSIESSTHDDWSMTAVFRKLDNGNVDNAIWDFVQRDRQQKNPTIMHDNQFMSRRKGNGYHSYREKTRPSLQVVFLFHDGDKVPYAAHMDMDRFPPGASYVTSVRHFFQEQVRHRVFRGKKDYPRMARSLKRIRDAQALTARGGGR